MYYLPPYGKLVSAQRQFPLGWHSTFHHESTTPDLGNNLIAMVMSQDTAGKNKQARKTQPTEEATLTHPTAASQNK